MENHLRRQGPFLQVKAHGQTGNGSKSGFFAKRGGSDFWNGKIRDDHSIDGTWKIRLLAWILGVAILLTPGDSWANDFALALYGARMTLEKWEQAVLPGAEYADSTLVAAAAAWTAHRFFHDKLSWEIEAVVGKHWGDQNHWEFNLVLAGFRWHRFPWDERLATSLAWGIGPSYATRVPEIELATNESSSRWLIYWFGELTLGPPKANWEALLRLHHRSDGFGIVHEDGGSNAVGAGIRYHF